MYKFYSASLYRIRFLNYRYMHTQRDTKYRCLTADISICEKSLMKYRVLMSDKRKMERNRVSCSQATVHGRLSYCPSCSQPRSHRIRGGQNGPHFRSGLHTSAPSHTLFSSSTAPPLKTDEVFWAPEQCICLTHWPLSRCNIHVVHFYHCNRLQLFSLSM